MEGNKAKQIKYAEGQPGSASQERLRGRKSGRRDPG